jgi:thioredoxin-related protein
MKRLLFTFLLQICFTVSAADGPSTEYDSDDEASLPYVEIQFATDFFQLAELARAEDKIIMLEVSASYCEYCDLLEEEFIKPMLRNDDYNTDVLIRKIDMDSYYQISDFSGDAMTPYEFTRRLKVNLTPTLLFFDANGNEVSQRILGINSLELYGGYIDEALNSGLLKIKSQ